MNPKMSYNFLKQKNSSQVINILCLARQCVSCTSIRNFAGYQRSVEKQIEIANQFAANFRG